MSVAVSMKEGNNTKNSPAGKLPNFFIIGVPRAATTSLYFYLRQHPDIFMPSVKEPGFFQKFNPEVPDRGERFDSYQQLFAAAGNAKAVGEASVGYLVSKTAAEAIHTHIPHAKIIAVLRNPLERAYSQYLLAQRVHGATHIDYGKILAQEAENIEKQSAKPSPASRLRNSFYYEGLSRYFALFGPQQIRIYLFEDFIARPLETVKDVFGFLGVDKTFVPDVSRQFSRGGVPASPAARFYIAIRNQMKKIFPDFFKGNFKNRIGVYIYSSFFTKVALPKKIYNQFIGMFGEDIEKTQHLIGRDLSHWLQPKKINLLFLDHQAEIGGGERSLMETIKVLDSNRFNSSVLLGADGPFRRQLEAAGIATAIIEIPKYFRTIRRDPQQRNSLLAFIKAVWILPRITKKLAAFLYEHKVDIIIANTIKSLSFGLPAAKRANAASVLVLREILTKDSYQLLLLMKIKEWVRQADRIICVSSAAKDACIRLAGKRCERKTSIIYNGIDVSIFNPARSGSKIKQELSLSNENIITSIGRFEPRKAQKIFIEAAYALSQQRQDVSFIIAGGPLFNREDYEQECKQLVRQRGLEKKIHFLGFRDDVADIIAASDIIVHASILPEGFGRSIVEAMACAKPVIATNSGGPKEIIAPCSGILIEPGDTEALMEAMLRLLENPGLRRSLGECARTRVQELFDGKIIGRQYEALFAAGKMLKT